MHVKIALSGFMGAGKSTVGKALAKELNLPCFETDILVVKESGRDSVRDIFERDGEIQFRELEREIWKELLEDDEEPCVISMGGGLIIQEENWEAVKDIHDLCLVYLSAKFETICTRLDADKYSSRPLAREPHELEELYKFREPLYKARSHITLDVDGKSVNEVVQEALQRIREFYGSST